MFKVISRDSSTGKFGVLDTDDFVVEFYEFTDLKKFISQGVTIEGIKRDNSTKVWDVALQSGSLPTQLTDKVKQFLKQATGELSEETYRDVCSHFFHLQRLGENLLKLSRKVKQGDIVDLIL